MHSVFEIVRRIAPGFLRVSLGIVLLWIGALKFVDPSPVVGLLDASLSFLASPSFVYLLGALEVVAAFLLFAGRNLAIVGVLVAGLFVGTLFIFLTTPAVVYGEAGFPKLTLAGEFLLKDLVLMAAALTVAATASKRASGVA